MNIALSTFLVFIFVLPGLAFRTNYYATGFASKVPKSPSDIIVWSFVPAILIHGLSLTIIYEITGYKVDYEMIGHILFGHKDENTLQTDLINFQANFKPILVYNAWVNITGLILGVIVRLVVRAFSLDIKHRQIRFSNNWTYLLNGETLQFPSLTDNPKTKYLIEGTIAHALIIQENDRFLYSGELIDYYTNKHGELQTIVLSGGVCKKMSDDGTIFSEHRLNDTELIIPFNQIANLRLRFLALKSKKEYHVKEFHRQEYFHDIWEFTKKILFNLILFGINSIIFLAIIKSFSPIIGLSIYTFLTMAAYFIATGIKKVITNRITDLVEDISSSDDWEFVPLKLESIYDIAKNSGLFEDEGEESHVTV